MIISNGADRLPEKPGPNNMRNLNYFVLTFLLLAAGLTCAQQLKPVKVESGLLQGISVDGVSVYKGVPYAAPPVGNLRWRAPQPPEHWKGILMADKFSANPMQVMVKELGPWTSGIPAAGLQ